MADQAQKRWWESPWTRWAATVLLPTALVVICPLLPAGAQVPCRIAGQVAHSLGSAAPPTPGTAPSSGPAESWWTAPCRDGEPPRSSPHFCKCLSGQWRDYWDAGTPCGG